MAVTLKGSLVVSYKLNTVLPCNWVIVLLGIYPTSFRSYAHIKTCMWMLQQLIHKHQKRQAAKRSFNRWMDNKLCCSQRIDFYSAILKNGLSSHKKAWMNLKCILLREFCMKRLHTVWFKSYDILEKAHYNDSKNKSLPIHQNLG